jgi:PKD repeat protein
MNAFKTLAATLATIALTACTVQKADELPELTSPSGAAMSISVAASPDSISFGGSVSQISVAVFGPNGRPYEGSTRPTIRLEMFVNGVQQDFGTLSRSTVVPESNGVAVAVYTSPPPPPGDLFGTCRGFVGACVEIVATPIATQANPTSFEAVSPQSVMLRLVPTGVIRPPASTPTAAFTFSPSPVTAKSAVIFDASTSLPGAGATQIVDYSWNFGDGTSGTGQTVTHTFGDSGSHNVTLTVTNDRGLSSSKTEIVPVGVGSLPTPAFTFSPSSPNVNEPVFFNAATSTAGAGHSIVSYRWTFGDGGTGSGVAVSHAFTAGGTFTVQLTVTDEAGQSATSDGTAVSVGSGNPTAVLTLTKTGVRTVVADGGGSTASGGTTIVSYLFAWGDASSTTTVPPIASAPHVYSADATYTVRLTVIDSLGRSGTSTQTVTFP